MPEPREWGTCLTPTVRTSLCSMPQAARLHALATPSRCLWGPMLTTHSRVSQVGPVLQEEEESLSQRRGPLTDSSSPSLEQTWLPFPRRGGQGPAFSHSLLRTQACFPKLTFSLPSACLPGMLTGLLSAHPHPRDVLLDPETTSTFSSSGKPEQHKRRGGLSVPSNSDFCVLGTVGSQTDRQTLLGCVGGLWHLLGAWHGQRICV